MRLVVQVEVVQLVHRWRLVSSRALLAADRISFALLCQRTGDVLVFAELWVLVRAGQFVGGDDAVVWLATLVGNVRRLGAVPVGGRRVAVVHVVLQGKGPQRVALQLRPSDLGAELR